MDQNNFKEQLELKTVNEEHVDQFNELLSYVFQFTEEDLEESGFERMYWRNVMVGMSPVNVNY